MRGKRTNLREGFHEQSRRQNMDSSLFYYEYLNNSLNYILSGSNDLDHTIHFDNQALRQIISNEPIQESLHFIERVKMMKTKCQEGLYLKDIQEHGQFINYELSKTNRQEIMCIQSELQEQFKINLLTKRLKKRYKTVDQRTNLYELYELQRQMKRQIVQNMDEQIVKYDSNLEVNKLYREMFNIQEVRPKKQQKVESKKTQKTKNAKGNNKKHKDQEFHAPASIKNKAPQTSSEKIVQKIISQDKAKREANIGGSHFQNQKIKPLISNPQTIQNIQNLSSVMNPNSLIRLPTLQSAKQKPITPVPQIFIGNVSDLLPNWGNMQVEPPNRINEQNNDLITQRTQHQESNQPSKNQLDYSKAIDSQKKQKKEKKIEKQEKQKAKKPKSTKTKEEKPQKQKRPYHRKPFIVSSQNLKMPQILATAAVSVAPIPIQTPSSAPIVVTPPPISISTSTHQPQPVHISSITINNVGFVDAQVQADTAVNDTNNGKILLPRIFSFTSVNQNQNLQQKRSQVYQINTQSRQMIPERVQNSSNLSNNPQEVARNRPTLNNSQRMDVQNRQQINRNPDPPVNKEETRKNSYNFEDFFNI